MLTSFRQLLETCARSTSRVQRLLLGSTLLFCLVWLGCDSASPVAPAGTVLSISANPDRIASDGTAEIRVVAQRPNGTPVNPGTQIRLTTTLGSIAATVETDDLGEALATLFGDGAFGAATISASTGGSEAATVAIQIGLAAGSITVQATPSSVPETGGDVDLLAIVRDDRGQPLGDAQVNFRTDTGSLISGGQLLTTDAAGSVVDMLTVTAADLDAVTGDDFQITAEVGGGMGSLLTTNLNITIQRLPRAEFSFGISNLTVVFEDLSTGRPTSWLWEFGDGNRSTSQNPTHTYAAAGTYVVTLRATNSQGSDEVSSFVAVTGQ